MSMCRNLSKSSDKSLYTESIRYNANATRLNEFISKTDKRAMLGESRRLMKTSNLMNENYLKQKRERLRELFSMENKYYKQELRNDFKRKTEEGFKDRENRLLGLRAERERQRVKFAEQMRAQQIVNNCDEIRPYLRQKLQDEYKNCQLLQIEDNNMKKKYQIDYDRLWHNVQTHVFNQMTERERNKLLIVRDRNLNNQKILKKQIADKNEIVQEVGFEKDTINCGNVIQAGITFKNEQIKLKQRQFAQDLLSQQEEKAKTQRDIKNREIEDDLAIINVVKDKIRVSKENLSKQKIQNMKETLHFLDYLKNVRKEKCLAETKIEEIIETVRNQKDCQYMNNRKQFTQHRDEFNKGIYQDRWKQIMDKKDKLLEEENQKIKEISKANKMYAEIVRMENVTLAKMRNFRKHYCQELLAQQNYEKQRKDEADFATSELMKTLEQEEKTKSELIKTNFGRIHENYSVHPNFNAILNSKN